MPDELAQEAANAGLLAPQTSERILRDRLRTDRIEKMQARAVLAGQPLEAMPPEEINTEIASYRLDESRTAGS